MYELMNEGMMIKLLSMHVQTQRGSNVLHLITYSEVNTLLIYQPF